MTPNDALRDGHLTEAIALQDAVVARSPVDPAARLYLVELLIVAIRYREAWDHLATIPLDTTEWHRSRRGFRRMIRLANLRERGAKPASLLHPPRHAVRRWKAIRALQNGDAETATDFLDRAEAKTPHLFGHIDGREFDGIRDSDDVLAGVLEAFVGRQYVWLPFEHLRRVTLQPVATLTDRAFRPARVRMSDGDDLTALLPLIYAGSATDDAFALGLDTDHVTPQGGPVLGVGAKILMMGEEELVLGEVRQLDFRAWV